MAAVHVTNQRVITHTQAFCNAVAAALGIWAEATNDPPLQAAVRSLPDEIAVAIDDVQSWLPGAVDGLGLPQAGITFGTGPAWAAALEAAILLKEVAGIPGEGNETREGATSSMFGIAPGDVAISLPTGPDPTIDEAERVCAARGAQVVRVPGGSRSDARLAAITTFPAAFAIATAIGFARGFDVDSPPRWLDDYYATAVRDGDLEQPDKRVSQMER
jgi:fructoselysine-6-P-deglycase FrlB-like protein